VGTGIAAKLIAPAAAAFRRACPTSPGVARNRSAAIPSTKDARARPTRAVAPRGLQLARDADQVVAQFLAEAAFARQCAHRLVFRQGVAVDLAHARGAGEFDDALDQSGAQALAGQLLRNDDGKLGAADGWVETALRIRN